MASSSPGSEIQLCQPLQIRLVLGPRLSFAGEEGVGLVQDDV
jgi:hypothetical protein